jgi:serine/threonine protein kinase
LKDEKEAAKFMYQTLLAVNYLHSNGIIHRDLKPENIVFEFLNAGADYIKIIDLGLAVKQDNPDFMVAGTLLYMAPEMLKDGSITTAVDIWSIGVLLFFILAGQYPFKNQQAIHHCNYSF